jgi:hypothetical protein
MLAAVPLLALGCGTPPCQELGERICMCTGIGKDSCKTQVSDQLKSADPGDAVCEQYLATCTSENASSVGAEFCEWLVTEGGKRACGITQ